MRRLCENRKSLLLTSVSFIASIAVLQPAFADNENALKDVVVSANRIPTAVSSIGSSVTIITAEDIEKRQVGSLYDVLEDVPGVHVYSSGNATTNARIKMRGFDSGRILILIDGVKVESQASQMYDRPLSTLQTDDIERIEILKGSQSSLYGSDAIGGVISITTKTGKDSKELVEGNAVVEMGSDVSRKASTSLRGRYEGVYYKVNATGLSTHGHDSRSDVDPNEHDGNRNVSYGAKVGADLVKDYGYLDLVNIEANYNYNRGDIEYDSSSGDTDGFANQKVKTGLIKLQADLFDGVLKNTFSASRMDSLTITRSNRQTGSASHYFGDLQRYEYEGVLQPAEGHALVYGVEQERDHYKFYRKNGAVESSNDVKSLVNSSAYMQYGVDLFDKSLSLTLGGRQEFHDEFGEHFTYRATGSYTYQPTQTRFHGSYSTGFKAPTLKQVFYNRDDQPKPVEPEESRGFDFGIEQTLLDGRLVVDTTGFYTRMKDELTMVWTSMWSGHYENLGSTRHMGVEASADFDATEELNFNLAYTFTQSRNNETGQGLDTAPRHIATLRTEYNPSAIDGLSTWLRVKAVSGSFTTSSGMGGGVGPRNRSAGYTTWDLGGDYRINNSLSVYGRVENIFDKAYGDTYQYYDPGISAAAGIRLKF